MRGISGSSSARAASGAVTSNVETTTNTTDISRKQQHQHRQCERGGGGESIEKKQLVRHSRKVYFENLQISQIDVQLSFTLPPNMSTSAKLSRVSAAAISILSFTNITSINMAPMILRTYVKQHSYGTRSDHLNAVKAHYASAALRQSYLLLGSSELFGNPMRILRAVREGLEDFSSGLSYGYATGNVGGAVRGGARGFLALVRHVTYSFLFTFSRSVANFADNLTAAAGTFAVTMLPKGAEARVAKRWIEEADLEGIALARRRNEAPKDKSLEWLSRRKKGYGVAVVPHNLVEGVLQALAGLLTEPVANSQLVPPWLFPIGALKGVVRGVIGVFVKIAVGSLKSCGSVSAEATRLVGGQRERGIDGNGGTRDLRQRAPRFFYTNEEYVGGAVEDGGTGDGGTGGGGAENLSFEGKLLVPYVEGENVGHELLSRVSGGKYLCEGYVWHGKGCTTSDSDAATMTTTAESATSGLVVLITSRRCVVLQQSELEGSYCFLEWEVDLKDIVHLECESKVEDNCLVIKIWHMGGWDGSRGNEVFGMTGGSSGIAGTGTGDDDSDWKSIVGVARNGRMGFALNSKTLFFPRNAVRVGDELLAELTKVVGKDLAVAVDNGTGWIKSLTPDDVPS